MTKEKQTKQEWFDNLSSILHKSKVSAILHIPSLGTFSMFYDESGRLQVLDQSKTELMLEEKERENTANNWLLNRLGKEKEYKKLKNNLQLKEDDIPSYIR